MEGNSVLSPMAPTRNKTTSACNENDKLPRARLDVGGVPDHCRWAIEIASLASMLSFVQLRLYDENIRDMRVASHHVSMTYDANHCENITARTQRADACAPISIGSCD